MIKLRIGIGFLYALPFYMVALAVSYGATADVVGLQTRNSDPQAKSQRVVVAGGSITEIIYALGEENRLVGVDTTSQWPEAATMLPQVGYLRNLSAEGVLSLSPSLLLATEDAGPPAVLEQIRGADLPVVILPDRKTLEGILTKVHGVARTLNATEKGCQLAAQIQNDFRRLKRFLSKIKTAPKVAFFLAISRGSPMGSGQDTAADAMIRLAGGRNALSGFQGYKPVSVESMIKAAPDVLLVTERTVNTLGSIEKLLNLPGIRLTPAGREERVIVMDTLYLLGFGPRAGQAALDLAAQLHPGWIAGSTHE